MKKWVAIGFLLHGVLMAQANGQTSAPALADEKIMAFLATRDASRAKEFYRDKLGLRLVSEEPIALVFDADGTMLRIQLVHEVTVAPYTALGWQVKDIAATAKRLQAAGITMLRVNGIQQDENGVWRPDPHTAVAWFKSPDGHTLSITQFTQ